MTAIGTVAEARPHEGAARRGAASTDATASTSIAMARCEEQNSCGHSAPRSPASSARDGVCCWPICDSDCRWPSMTIGASMTTATTADRQYPARIATVPRFWRADLTRTAKVLPCGAVRCHAAASTATACPASTQTATRLNAPAAATASACKPHRCQRGFSTARSRSRVASAAKNAAAAFFAALATLLLLRAVENPRWHRWGLHALAVAAAGAFNLVAVCVLAGHAVAVLAAAWQRTAPHGSTFAVRVRSARQNRGTVAILAGYCLSAVVAVVIDAPIVIEGHRQSLSQIGQQQTPSLAELAGLRGALWPQLFCSSHLAIAILVLAVASVLAAPRRAAPSCGLAFATVPIAVIWLISQGPASYWVVRYLMFTVPAWALSAGLGGGGLGDLLLRVRAARLGSALQPRYLVATGLVVAVGLLGVHDQRAIRQPQAHNRWAYPLAEANGEPVDYQGAAEVIAAHERRGDGIVYQVSDHNHYQVDTSVAYYLRVKAKSTPVFQAKTQAQAGTLQPVECDGPARCLAGTHRLWVVYVNHLVLGSYLDPFLAMPPAEAAVLRERGYHVRALYKEDGITVALMARR